MANEWRAAEQRLAAQQTTERLVEREKELADDVAESEQVIASGNGWVNSRGLAADRRLLRIVRAELKRRKTVGSEVCDCPAVKCPTHGELDRDELKNHGRRVRRFS